MTYILFAFSTVIFIESFLFLDLSIQVRRILSESQLSWRILASGTHGEEQKEAQLRHSSRVVGAATGILALKLALTTAVVAMPYALIAVFRPEVTRQILADLSSPVMLPTLTVVAFAYTWLRHVIFRTL
jgi:hypothetical protein